MMPNNTTEPSDEEAPPPPSSSVSSPSSSNGGDDTPSPNDDNHRGEPQDTIKSGVLKLKASLRRDESLEMEQLRERNEELEGLLKLKNHSARTSDCGDVDKISDTDDNAADTAERPQQRRRSSVIDHASSTASLTRDTYSFPIFLSWTSSGTCLAFFVFVLQMLLFSFVLIDTINLGSDSNPLGFPANVSPVVRASQFFLIILAVFMQDDVRVANQVIFNGYNRTGIASAFSGEKDESVTKVKWIFSIVCRFSQGVFGLSVVIIRLMIESTVIELLFNFTALEFISKIDDVVFFLSEEGYLGQENQCNAKKVSNRTFSVKDCRSSQKVAKTGSALLILAGLAFWAFVLYLQSSGSFMCKTVYVQFDDAYSTDLASFSGLYELRTEGFSQLKRYFQSIPGNQFDGKAMLGYCAKEKSWTLTYDNELDPCKWHAKSSEMENDFSYDILHTADRPWYTTSSGEVGGMTVPAKSFYMACYDCEGSRSAISCGDGRSCSNNRCDCGDGHYGHRCEFTTPCATLEVDSRYEGFLGSRIWSKRFEILTSDDDRILGIYGRPIYVNEGTVPIEVMLFNGRRWVLATVENLGITGGLMSIASDFHAYWSKPIFAFMSEAMETDTPNDRATPLQLDWYLIPSVNRLRPRVSDLVLQPSASLLCGRCNDSTNRCAFEGVCIDGICDCVSGSLGLLCQIPPLGNARCDPLFNTPEFNYDGGDCCQGTCMSTLQYKCGTSLYSTLSNEPAFGMYVSGFYTGYENCQDPGQLCAASISNCLKSSSSPLPFDMAYDDSSRGFYMHFYMTGRTVVVSGDGTCIAVGSPGGDSVAVYMQNGSEWEQLGGEINGPEGSRYGYAVDLSDDGSVVAIGAPYVNNIKGTIDSFEFDPNTPGFAHVYRYHPDLKSWLLLGQPLKNGAGGDLFGLSISLNAQGSKMAIGSPKLDVGEFSAAGNTKVYNFDSHRNAWVEEGSIGGKFSNAFQFFGYSLSLADDGKSLAVGSPEFGDIFHLGKVPRNQGRGNVRVFKLDDKGQWVQEGADITPGIEDDNRSFGFAVAISSSANGNLRIAVGDPMGGISNELPNEGVVRVFEFENKLTNKWSQIGQDVMDRHGWLELGASVALKGDVLAVGARKRFASTAYAKFYDFLPSVGWQERISDSSEVSQTGSITTGVTGYIVSLSNDGNIMVVGQTGYEDSNEKTRGKIQVFNNPSGVPIAAPLVSLSVVIWLGEHPEETSISFTCGTEVHVSIAAGSLMVPQQMLAETFVVREGSECKLKNSDVKNSGVLYEIYFGSDTSDRSNLLAKGGQSFLWSESVSIRASPPTDTMLLPVTLRLRLDFSPADTYITLKCGSSYMFESYRGAFTERFAKVLTTFYLEKDSECNLEIGDGGGYGLCCVDSFGSYQVYYGDQESVDITNTSNILVYGNGVFEISESKVFNVSNTNTDVVSPLAFGIQETRPGEAKSSSIPITLHIRLDSNPHETGFSIQCNDGLDIKFPPSTFAGMENHWLVETLPFEEGTSCMLSVQDSGGDGLLNSYVRLYEGVTKERENTIAEILSFSSHASLNFTVSKNTTTVTDHIPESICHVRSMFIGSEIAGINCVENDGNHIGDSNDGITTEETCTRNGARFVPYTCDEAEEYWIFKPKTTQEFLRGWWHSKCCVNKNPSETLISLSIKLDGQPEETSWELDCEGDSQFASRKGMYAGQAYSRVSSSFLVQRDSQCNLTIFDAAENGLCCKNWFGSYQVFNGIDITNTSNLLAIGNGTFNGQDHVRFLVSTNATLPSISAVTLHMRLDYLPFETGFRLQCDDGSKLSYGPGYFPAGTEMAEIVETFLLREGTRCQFAVEDLGGNGLCCDLGQGFVRLYNGYDTGARTNLFVEIVHFGLLAETNFTVPLIEVEYKPESICSISRDLLMGNEIARISCTTGGDSNDETTTEELCIKNGGDWNSYNCNDAEGGFWTFQSNSTKIFLRGWWESKCCSPELF